MCFFSPFSSMYLLVCSVSSVPRSKAICFSAFCIHLHANMLVLYTRTYNILPPTNMTVWASVEYWMLCCQKYTLILCMILPPNHEFWRTNLSKQAVRFSKRGGFYLHLRQFPWCSTWREQCNIPGIFLYYVCQHCIVHCVRTCKMTYSVQHHPCWTHGDG